MPWTVFVSRQAHRAPLSRWAAATTLTLGALIALRLASTDGPRAVLAALVSAVAALAISEAGAHRARGRSRRLAASLTSDVNGIALLVNDDIVTGAFGSNSEILGFAPEATIGLPISQAIRVYDDERLAEAFTHAVGTNPAVTVSGLALLDRHPDDEADQRFIDVTVRDRTFDRVVRSYVVTIVDATDRATALRHLAKSAASDPETGLANRERLAELLNMTLHRARRKGDHVTVLAVGVDQYDAIRDGFDEISRADVMTEFGRRIRAAVRLEDAVGRLSPDVFGVVLGGLEPRIGRAFALDIADRISTTVALPYAIDGTRIEMGATIGAAHRSQGSPEPTAWDLLAQSTESLEQVRANTNRWSTANP